MEIKLTAINIVQGQKAGSVQLAIPDKDGNPSKDEIMIVLQFPIPKEAGSFIHGSKYSISINLSE